MRKGQRGREPGEGLRGLPPLSRIGGSAHLKRYQNEACKKRPTACRNACGCSKFERWPAWGMTTNCAPGIFVAYSCTTCGGIRTSCSPTNTNVGYVILPSKSVASAL